MIEQQLFGSQTAPEAGEVPGEPGRTLTIAELCHRFVSRRAVAELGQIHPTLDSRLTELQVGTIVACRPPHLKTQDSHQAKTSDQRSELLALHGGIAEAAATAQCFYPKTSSSSILHVAEVASSTLFPAGSRK